MTCYRKTLRAWVKEKLLEPKTSSSRIHTIFSPLERFLTSCLFEIVIADFTISNVPRMEIHALLCADLMFFLWIGISKSCYLPIIWLLFYVLMLLGLEYMNVLHLYIDIYMWMSNLCYWALWWSHKTMVKRHINWALWWNFIYFFMGR